MRIARAERFQRDVRGLEAHQRNALFDVVLALPGVLGDPHRHAGMGIRKLHASGVWEARVGLGIRLVFTVESGVTTLVTAGSHEDIRWFLRSL